MFKQRISLISAIILTVSLFIVVLVSFVLYFHNVEMKRDAKVTFTNETTFCPPKEKGEDTNIYGQTMEEANNHRNWKNGVYTPVCLGVIWSFEGETSNHFLYLTASSTEEEIVEAVQKEAEMIKASK
ncbi:MAG: hypothetical protein WC346_01300 [Methanogenium sp.]